MVGVTAVRTRKGMSRSGSKQSTSGTGLRRVGGIDLGGFPLPSDFVGRELPDHTAGPDREPPVQGFGPLLLSLLLLLLREREVFKDEHTVLRGPFDKLLGCTMTEVPGSPRSLERQPFEGTNNASRVLSLCLLRFEFRLKPGVRLARSGVEYSSVQSGDEQSSPVRVYGNDRIRLVEIDPHRDDSRSIRDLERHANVPDEGVPVGNNNDTVDGCDVGERVLEHLGDVVSEMFPPADSPYRQRSVRLEPSVTSSRPDEEESVWGLPTERAGDLMPVLPGRHIRPGSEPDRGAGELTRKDAFDRGVFGLVQTKSIERLAGIVCRGRNLIADAGKHIERLPEVLIRFNDHMQRLLDKHLYPIATKELSIWPPHFL